MKLEFTAEGVLRIIPESPIEQFALTVWDRTKVEIVEKDYYFSMMETSKQIEKLIKERMGEYEEFLRKKQQVSAGDGNG